MKNIRFTEILRIIVQGKKAERFGELVNSPFFNKNQRVSRLWEWIKSADKSITEKDFQFSKEELLEAIEPDETLRGRFTDANLRMVLSDFVKLGEAFLLLEESTGDDPEMKMKLAEILKAENAYKGYRQRVLEIEQKLRSTELRDAGYYNTGYWLECEKLVNENGALKPERLKAADQQADLSWMATKLDSTIKMQLIDQSARNLDFTEEILRKIEADEKSYKKDHAVIYSRYLILKMFSHGVFEGNPYFTALEKYTAKQKSRELQRYNYDALMAYCRSTDNTEKEFSLILKMDKLNLLTEEGELPDAEKIIRYIECAEVLGKHSAAQSLKNRYLPRR